MWIQRTPGWAEGWTEGGYKRADGPKFCTCGFQAESTPQRQRSGFHTTLSGRIIPPPLPVAVEDDYLSIQYWNKVDWTRRCADLRRQNQQVNKLGFLCDENGDRLSDLRVQKVHTKRRRRSVKSNSPQVKIKRPSTLITTVTILQLDPYLVPWRQFRLTPLRQTIPSLLPLCPNPLPNHPAVNISEERRKARYSKE